MELFNLSYGIELILNDDVKGLQELFKVKQETICFETKKDFISYVCGFDISVLFNGKTEVNCIFHNDKKPSASIHIYNGCYFFTCHSENCKQSGSYNIISLIKLVKGCSKSQAEKYVSKYFNCTFCEGKEDCNIIQHNLELIDRLQDIAPTANKILGEDKQVLMHLYNNVLTGKYTKIKNKIVLSISTRQLMREMGKELKASRSFAVLGYLEIIRRIPPYELSEEKLDEMIELCRYREDAVLRIPTYIEIEELTYKGLKETERCALRWKELGYTKTKFTAKEVFERDGWVKMIQLYPQL